MLTPSYLEDIPKTLVQIYSNVEIDIISQMAKRMSNMDFISAAQFQYQRLIELGYIEQEITKLLAKALNISKLELLKIMNAAGIKSYKADLTKLGLPMPKRASNAMQQVIESGYQNTTGLFENITRTTVESSKNQFVSALDDAWFKVSTGLQDTETAVTHAIKDLSEKGIKTASYASGHSDSIDVAVRRATVTGVNQSAIKMTLALAQELNHDLVETTAHGGARTGNGVANHAEWQGKIFSLSGSDKYSSFYASTGYGTGAGLGGWNCRHSINLTSVESSYTKEELKDLNAPKYPYNDEMLTESEAIDIQRYNERQIRKWRRQSEVLKVAGIDNSREAAKVKYWQLRQADFINQTGLTRQYQRERV